MMMGDEVAELCHKKYEELGKSGKPGQGEWTTLGGVVVEDGEERWVASLATGTKCLGGNALRPDGVLLSDSHAEILARRALLNFLYDEIEECFKTGSSKILSHHKNGKCHLKPSVKFHFYCSHVPCGDASIIEMTASDVLAVKSREQDVGPVVLVDTVGDTQGNKRSSYEAADGKVQVMPDHRGAKKMKLEGIVKLCGKLSDEEKNCAGKGAHSGGTRSNCTHKDIENVLQTGAYALPEVESNSERREVEGVGVAKGVEGGVLDMLKTGSKSVAGSGQDPRLEGVGVAKVVEGGVVDMFRMRGSVAGSGQDPQLEGMGAVKVAEGGVVDVYRTGGKCVAGIAQDPRLEGVMYHVVGAVRTKPGRGDPTLSLSCSDKVTRWLHTGLQGGLVSLLLDGRVRLASVTVGGGGPYSQAALTRALSRAGTITLPLYTTSHSFPHSKYRPNALRPSPASLVYSLNRSTEVAVEGRKLGVTKKSKSIQLTVSRKELFKRFLSLASEDFSRLSYFEAKARAVEYCQESTEFKKNIGAWTVKPPVDFRND